MLAIAARTRLASRHRAAGEGGSSEARGVRQGKSLSAQGESLGIIKAESSCIIMYFHGLKTSELPSMIEQTAWRCASSVEFIDALRNVINRCLTINTLLSSS